MQSLAQAVTDQTPLQHGFEVGLWTLSILRELIRRQFGQTMALSSVSRVMSLLGITVQKPLYRAWQQDPERVRKWETEEFPAIKQQAREQGRRCSLPMRRVSDRTITRARPGHRRDRRPW